MGVAQILVAEDDHVVAGDICDKLVRLGYNVPLVVASGEDAADKAVELQPDLVLMDVNFEGALNGIEAAGYLRTLYNIPVVYLLTARTDDATIERARDTEPSGFLVMPIDETELHTTVEIALVRHKAATANQETRERLEHTVDEQTAELTATYEQLQAEVSERRQTEEKLRAANKELVQKNYELNKARQRAEEASRLKTEFLSAVSHELRTPLHSINGFAQLLLVGRSGELNEAQEENLERILASGRKLLGLIDGILDLSKIEAERMSLVQDTFSVQDWLDAIALEGRAQAEEKGLCFETVLDADMPNMIVGDRGRLRQIADHLVSNAVKFTDQGEVILEVRRQGIERWELVVADTGIGIAPEDQDYIFEEFRQVDGAWNRRYNGAGLGLAIVRRLTLLMNGEVRVESNVGEGSTFTVSLPLVVE